MEHGPDSHPQLTQRSPLIARFANPEIVVPELTPPVCNATTPASNWNSAYFDQVMADFYGAVCGPDAAAGQCTHSVIQQLSTMPAWMYNGGYNKPLPADPWNTTDPFDAYGAGGSYVDKTCGQVARYFGRLVGWYTAGGFTDECGHFHESKFHYKWYGLSVLNEDEHHIQPENGPAYTQCFDAIKVEVGKINSDIVIVGPEIVGGSWSWSYMKYFLDANNHADKLAPPIATWHWFGGMFHNATAEGVLTRWMHDFYDPNGIVRQIDRTIKATGQKTEVGLNEFIPFIDDYCNCTGHEEQCNNYSLPTGIGDSKCPNWQLPKTGGGEHDSSLGQGIGINRATWSWNAAAAVFALGYATLAELGYAFVGADQLVGGVWPDNEPAVSCLDWQTGEPNAKYYAIQALARTVGSSAPKTIFTATTGQHSPPVGTIGNGTCGATSYGGDCDVLPKGAWHLAAENITDLASCVARAKKCKMADYVSFSDVAGNQDCSWYSASECDFSNLCEDCSKCGLGCPHYYPYSSEVVRQTVVVVDPIYSHSAVTPSTPVTSTSLTGWSPTEAWNNCVEAGRCHGAMKLLPKSAAVAAGGVVATGGPPPTPPAGTIGNGTCGATNYGGDCDVLPKGAWHLAAENITDLASCVARAKKCKMAQYVSFSDVAGNQDCSWYSGTACDWSHLCEDCSKCGIGCPHYYPYSSEVLPPYVPQPTPPPAPTPPPPPTPPTKCYVDNAQGPVTYVGGNIFGNKHLVNQTSSADGCCALCQQYASSKNCTFWQYDSSGCYGSPLPGCCRLKNEQAWAGRSTYGPATTTSGSIKPLPPLPPTPAPPPPPSSVHVMAYEMASKKGMLLVNLKARTQVLHLAGVHGGTATVIEVATAGPDAATPGFAKPATRQVSAAGDFSLGPFGIAVVSDLLVA
jgi:hypothetical protein